MEEKYLMEKLREIRRMETYIWNTGHRMARRWLDREELYKGDPHSSDAGVQERRMCPE